jgi:glucosyl-dolichyl phosphate glucuronosyltransferase
MKSASITIVICTRNRLGDLKNFLLSLATQTLAPFELIIVDSSDTPLQYHLSFASLCSSTAFPKTCVDYVHTQPGLTYQRNIGVARATGDVLYFFDDDVILEPTYLEKMNAIFMCSPHYGGGMGTITNLPQKIQGWQRALRVIFLLQRDYAAGLFTWSGMPTHAYGLQEFKEVEVLGGCCMAYRRTMLQHHSFDEALTRYAYMEDCDVSYRISRDAPLFYNPQARLQHHNSPLARDRVVDNRAMFIRNYSYLFFKNFYPTNKLRIVAYGWSILGLFIEAILVRNRDYIKGYAKGLVNFYIKK